MLQANTDTHTFTDTHTHSHMYLYTYAGIKGVISIKIINSLRSIRHYNCGLAFISISVCFSIYDWLFLCQQISNFDPLCVCVAHFFYCFVVTYFFLPAFGFAFECPKNSINWNIVLCVMREKTNDFWTHWKNNKQTMNKWPNHGDYIQIYKNGWRHAKLNEWRWWHTNIEQFKFKPNNIDFGISTEWNQSNEGWPIFTLWSI